RLAAILGPLRDLRSQRSARSPFRIGICNYERESRRIRDLGTIAREHDNWNARSAAKLFLCELSNRRLHFGLIVKRRAAITDYLLHRGLVADAEAVRAG